MGAFDSPFVTEFSQKYGRGPNLWEYPEGTPERQRGQADYLWWQTQPSINTGTGTWDRPPSQVSNLFARGQTSNSPFFSPSLTSAGRQQMLDTGYGMAGVEKPMKGTTFSPAMIPTISTPANVNPFQKLGGAPPSAVSPQAAAPSQPSPLPSQPSLASSMFSRTALQPHVERLAGRPLTVEEWSDFENRLAQKIGAS